MDQLDKMLEQFKDMGSLQKFAEAQQKTIQALTRKLKITEEENLELKVSLKFKWILYPYKINSNNEHRSIYCAS